MKKLLLTLAITLVGTSMAFAQKPTFVVNGGLQVSTIQAKNWFPMPTAGNANLAEMAGKLDKSLSQQFGYLPNFRVGVNADIPLFSSLSLVTGLNYVVKGTTVKMDELQKLASFANVKLNNKMTFNYLEVPALLNLKLGLNNLLAVHVGGGAYFGYALSGSFKPTKDIEINPFKPAEGSKEALLSPFDYGAEVTLGLEVSRVVFTLGVQRSFANLIPKDFRQSKDESNNPSLKNLSAFLTVGYRF